MKGFLIDNNEDSFKVICLDDITSLRVDFKGYSIHLEKIEYKYIISVEYDDSNADIELFKNVYNCNINEFTDDDYVCDFRKDEAGLKEFIKSTSYDILTLIEEDLVAYLQLQTDEDTFINLMDYERDLNKGKFIDTPRGVVLNKIVY